MQQRKSRAPAKKETKDVPCDRMDLKEGMRIVCRDGKARRVFWLRAYESVVMYRFDGLENVHRLLPGEAVNIRVQV